MVALGAILAASWTVFLVSPGVKLLLLNRSRGGTSPPAAHGRVGFMLVYRTNRGWPRRGFISAETLAQNGTTGDNGTAGGTLNSQHQGFW